MAPITYAEMLARNIRAVRSRKGLAQTSVVARMRALGFDGWHRPTLGNVERGERGVKAEEIFGLALALGTNIPLLMGAASDEDAVELPGGSLDAGKVALLAFGRNHGWVQWDESDRPIFTEGVPATWRGDMSDDPALAWNT